MNIPQYQKKDYSFLQNAFTGLGQGAQQFQQGIVNQQQISANERKRQQEEEYIKQLKISREDSEKVRENAIINAAVQLREAMGLPDTDEGRDIALTEASKLYPKATASEWQTGGATMRYYNTEKDVLPQVITKHKMNQFRNRVTQPTIQENLPPVPQYTEPQGTVGVEDQGKIQRPLSAFPQSKQEMQQSASRELATQPRVIPTVSTPQTDEDRWKYAVQQGISQEPEVKDVLGRQGRMSTLSELEGQPVTKESVSEGMLRKPVIEGTELVGNLPSSEDAKKREIERIKASKGTGSDVKYKDLLAEYRQLQSTQSQIEARRAVIADKLRNPMRREKGETEEVLVAGLQNSDAQLADIRPKVKALESDVSYMRSELKFPEPPKEQTPTGPSQDAQKVSSDIEKAIKNKAPRNWTVVSRYGKPVYTKGKGPKVKYDAQTYNQNLVEEVSNYAKTLGVEWDAKQLSTYLQKYSLSEVIDTIQKISAGNK